VYFYVKSFSMPSFYICILLASFSRGILGILGYVIVPKIIKSDFLKQNVRKVKVREVFELVKRVCK